MKKMRRIDYGVMLKLIFIIKVGEECFGDKSLVLWFLFYDFGFFC